MPESKLPRYLDARQGGILRLAIDEGIELARRRLIDAGADPGCLDHEVGLALARAACRFDMDLLAGAGETIERLEAVVAELGARVSQAKIAARPQLKDNTPREADPYVNALHVFNGIEARASAELAGAHEPNCLCDACGK